MIERKTKYNLLYDLYQDLLTDKQKQFTELYFHDDLSFAEIAEEFAISRQGVYEHIKRTERLLDDYEEKLQLLAKNLRLEELIQDLELALNSLDKPGLGHIQEIISQIKTIE